MNMHMHIHTQRKRQRLAFSIRICEARKRAKEAFSAGPRTNDWKVGTYSGLSAWIPSITSSDFSTGAGSSSGVPSPSRYPVFML